MDSVRFGRALGRGTRSAAKALVMAAEAATTPGGADREASARSAAKRGEGVARSAVYAAAQTTTRVRATHQGLARGGKRFGEAAWGPFVRLSGVLWLELTGVFFGLFLLTATVSAWKLRDNLEDRGVNHADHVHLLWSIAVAVVFGYFCVSSFVRAARRGRTAG